MIATATGHQCSPRSAGSPGSTASAASRSGLCSAGVSIFDDQTATLPCTHPNGMMSRLPPLADQFHGQAELPGQQARALALPGTERARDRSEPDMVQRAPQRQAVLLHEPDPLASGPG